jgi:hypothetical protein
LFKIKTSKIIKQLNNEQIKVLENLTYILRFLETRRVATTSNRKKKDSAKLRQLTKVRPEKLLCLKRITEISKEAIKPTDHVLDLFEVFNKNGDVALTFYRQTQLCDSLRFVITFTPK